MAKAKQQIEEEVTPTLAVEEAQPVALEHPKSGADEIVLDPSQFQEVILGSSVAAPLPQTWERVDN